MSDIAEEASKLRLSEFLSFSVKCSSRRHSRSMPDCGPDQSRLRLARSLALELKSDWETITVSKFLESYTFRDIRRFPNVGRKSIGWLIMFLAAFELRLRGTNSDVGTRTVLSAEAESVLAML